MQNCEGSISSLYVNEKRSTNSLSTNPEHGKICVLCGRATLAAVFCAHSLPGSGMWCYIPGWLSWRVIKELILLKLSDRCLTKVCENHRLSNRLWCWLACSNLPLFGPPLWSRTPSGCPHSHHLQRATLAERAVVVYFFTRGHVPLWNA